MINNSVMLYYKRCGLTLKAAYAEDKLLCISLYYKAAFLPKDLNTFFSIMPTSGQVREEQTIAIMIMIMVSAYLPLYDVL